MSNAMHSITKLNTIEPVNLFKSVPELMPYLLSNDLKMRQAAVESLAVITAADGPERSAALYLTAIPALVRVITSIRSGSWEEVAAAATALTNIVTSESTQKIAMEENAIPPLVALLTSGDNAIIEPACQALGNVCVSKGDMVSGLFISVSPPARTRQDVALGARALPPLVLLLSHHNVRIQAAAADTLFKICVGNIPAANTAHEGNAVPALVRLLSSDSPEAQKHAAFALSQICYASEPPRVIALGLGAIPVLTGLIASNNHDSHEAAALALLIINRLPAAREVSLSSNIFPPLIKLLDSEDVTVLIRACHILKSICWSNDGAQASALTAGAIPCIIRLLSHPSGLVQISSTEALNIICFNVAATVAMHDGNVVPALVKLLSSSDPALQNPAAMCLSQMCFGYEPSRVSAVNLNAIPVLVCIITSNNHTVYEAATRALGNINALPAAGAVSVKANALPALIKLMGSNDLKVLELVCKAMSRICFSKNDCQVAAVAAGAVSPLVRLLSHTSQPVQSVAAGAISHLCGTVATATAVRKGKAIPALVHLLSSNDTTVQKSGAQALHQVCFNDKEAKYVANKLKAIPTVVRLVASNNSEVHEAAAAALADLALDWFEGHSFVKAGAIPALVRLLESKDARIVQSSCRALQHISGSFRYIAALVSKEVPQIRSLLASEHVNVQLAVLSLFHGLCGFPEGKIAIKDCIPALRKLNSSHDSNVRQVVASLLKQL